MESAELPRPFGAQKGGASQCPYHRPGDLVDKRKQRREDGDGGGNDYGCYTGG